MNELTLFERYEGQAYNKASEEKDKAIMHMVIGGVRLFQRRSRRSGLLVGHISVLLRIGRFLGDGVCALSPRFLGIGASTSGTKSVKSIEWLWNQQC